MMIYSKVCSTVVLVICFASLDAHTPNIQEVEKILTQGSDAAKIKLLDDIFLSEPRQIDPRNVRSSLLFDLLNSKNMEVKDWALTFLGNREWNEPKFFETFERIAKNQKEHVRIREMAIYFISLRHTDSLTFFSEMTKDSDPKIRTTALSDLVRLKINEGNVKSIQTLILQAVDDPDEEVRFQVLSSLVNGAEKNKGILDLPRNASPLIRANVRAAKVEIDPMDKRSIGELFDLLLSENQQTREVAARGLTYGRYFTPHQVKLMNAAMLDKSPKVRGSICFLAGYLPAESSMLLPNLSKCMNDNSASVRRWAVCAVGFLGDKKYIPDLITALKDNDSTVRYESLEALVRIGDNSQMIIDAIHATIGNRSIVPADAEDAIKKLKGKRTR